MRHRRILVKLGRIHHERGWVVPHMTRVVRVSLGWAGGRMLLLLLLLDDLLCFIGGHGHFVL